MGAWERGTWEVFGENSSRIHSEGRNAPISERRHSPHCALPPCSPIALSRRRAPRVEASHTSPGVTAVDHRYAAQRGGLHRRHQRREVRDKWGNACSSHGKARIGGKT